MKKGIVALMVLVCLGLGGAIVCMKVAEDSEAPKIEIVEDHIVYSEGEDYGKLLQNVTAVDARDGDVTASLVIEGVYPNENETTATVIYAARDKKNNVGKKTRIVDYQPLMQDSPVNQEDTGNDAVKDEPDKKPEDAAANVEEDNISNPDEEELKNLPPQNPRLILKHKKLTVKKGEAVDRISMVKSITDDKDSKEILWTKIQIYGDFNANVPGTYEQVFCVVDSDGNRSNEAKMTIVVE